jgi:hypothetical protein
MPIGVIPINAFMIPFRFCFFFFPQSATEQKLYVVNCRQTMFVMRLKCVADLHKTQ